MWAILRAAAKIVQEAWQEVKDERESEAADCINRKDYQAAEQIYRDILQERASSLGRNHPDTLQTMANLADVLEKQGKHGEVEQIRTRLRQYVRRR